MDVSYQLYPLLLNSESCIRWWHTQTRMTMRVVWVWKTPATPTTWLAEKTTVVDDRQMKKAVKMNPKRRVCKITNKFQKAGVMLWQSTVLRRLWHRITDATQQDANLWSAPKIERQDSSLQQKHKCETEEFWNCVYGPMRQRWTFI